MIKSPLVSVVIISYNAENYIIEALDSVKNQTYKKLELVISDDASSDKTADIIEKWLKENNDNFEHVVFMRNKANMGITKNLNQAVKATTGEFVKLLASDDILFEDAILELIKFCLDYNLDYCFSSVLPFDDENSEKVKKIAADDFENSKKFFDKTQRKQYQSLLKLTTPLTFTLGGFYKTFIIHELGYFEEKYPMQEDYSFALKLSKKGKKFIKANVYSYKYRVRTNLDENYKKSNRYIQGYECMKRIRQDYVLGEMFKNKMFLSFLYLKITMFILELEFKGNSKIINKIANCGRRFKQLLMSMSKK
jgi:alpha-1,3-rhamnosyltransferase